MDANADPDSYRILVVDDDQENLMILQSCLSPEFQVVTANGGRQALTLARASPAPDIVLLDILMPDLDGFGVLKRLRDQPITRDIPVIFLTSLDDTNDEMVARELGAIDYISKPIDIGLLRLRVRNQLELKRYREHLEDMVKQRTRTLTLIQQVSIETISHLAEFRDPETGGHINRTRTYVRLLAEQLRGTGAYLSELTPATIELLELSAPMHDIGKVAISDRVLLKPGKLTVEEFDQMKQHTVFGERILRQACSRLGRHSFLTIAAEIAGGHHERWDGRGYPRGLHGDDIPLAGRIMALADVYDALISKRVYKPAFSHSKAMSIISEGRGAHFDPTIVDAFLSIHGEFRECAQLHADSYHEPAELVT